MLEGVKRVRVRGMVKGQKRDPFGFPLPLLTVLSLVTLFTIKEFGVKRVTLVRRGKEGKSKRYDKGAKKRPLCPSLMVKRVRGRGEKGMVKRVKRVKRVW